MKKKKMTEDQFAKYEAVIAEFKKHREPTEEEKELLMELIMTGTFMDLRCDWAFKHIMQNKEILLMLLNDILPEPVDKITLQPNEINRLFEGDKDATMDVLCESGDRKFIVEIQQKKKRTFRNRMYYYGAAMSHSQLMRGDEYGKLMPVYVICFMNFMYAHQDDKLIYRYAMREEETGELYGNQLNIYFCELPRLRKRSMKGLNPLEGWLYLLKNLHKFAQRPEGMDERFDIVVEAARMNSLPDPEQIEYLMAMISEKEKKELLESGYENGLEDGAAQKAIDIARQMLAKGLDAQMVSEITGLTAEEIAAL